MSRTAPTVWLRGGFREERLAFTSEQLSQVIAQKDARIAALERQNATLIELLREYRMDDRDASKRRLRVAS